MEENINVVVRVKPLDDEEKSNSRVVWQITKDLNTIECTEGKANRSLAYNYGIFFIFFYFFLIFF